jgi:hypothetical protein
MTPTITHTADPDRVRANTPQHVNVRLDAEAAARMQDAAENGANLHRRIADLDREWDFERVLQTEASIMGLSGLALGIGVHRSFLIVPGFVAAMMLLHAFQGWYPLLPLFRWIGVRSRDEIDRERYALKVLRGDFEAVRESSDGPSRADAAWQAVSR